MCRVECGAVWSSSCLCDGTHIDTLRDLPWDTLLQITTKHKHTHTIIPYSKCELRIMLYTIVYTRIVWKWLCCGKALGAINDKLFGTIPRWRTEMNGVGRYIQRLKCECSTATRGRMGIIKRCYYMRCGYPRCHRILPYRRPRYRIAQPNKDWVRLVWMARRTAQPAPFIYDRFEWRRTRSICVSILYLWKGGARRCGSTRVFGKCGKIPWNTREFVVNLFGIIWTRIWWCHSWLWLTINWFCSICDLWCTSR